VTVFDNLVYSGTPNQMFTSELREIIFVYPLMRCCTNKQEDLGAIVYDFCFFFQLSIYYLIIFFPRWSSIQRVTGLTVQLNV
jgi:hypothetical protein